jgi:hypothetical protein
MPRTKKNFFASEEERKAYRREVCRRYRERHPDRVKESHKKDYEKHKVEKSIYAKAYNADPKNKAKILERSRRYEKSPTRIAYKQKYYEENREWIDQRNRSYQEQHKEHLYDKALEWRESNKDKYDAAQRRYAGSRKSKDRFLRYEKRHPKRISIKNNLRRAMMLQRLPGWADKEKIAEIYRNCPNGMVVDHKVPLVGRLVSGLHIETNLQYLTPEENLKKSNKFEPRYLTSSELEEINGRIKKFFSKVEGY